MDAFATAIVDGESEVTGGLIDSYVAGHEKDRLSEANGLRVGTVFDHQFAYGFVISNSLETQLIERCMRRTLSTEESYITNQIQEGMEALPVCFVYFYSLKENLSSVLGLLCKNKQIVCQIFQVLK